MRYPTRERLESRRQSVRSGAIKYASAVAIAAATVALRWILIPWVGADAPYATIMGAVAIVVWLSGWGPAMVTAILGLIGTAMIIGRPLGTLPVDRIHTVLGLALYTTTCALIIGLGEGMRRTRDAYRRSQERFLRSQEAAIQGYGLVKTLRDSTGAIQDFELEYINPLGASIHRGIPDDFTGRHITQVMPGVCAEGLLEALRGVVESGAPIDLEIADPTQQPTTWLRYMIVKVEDGAAMSFSDITQNKQLAQELKQRANDLQRLNNIKSLFLATLAHELRNPLAPIRYGLATLQSRRPRELDDITAMMERQLQLATRLIDDLLDASRIDRGTLTLRNENITLESFVNAGIETARPNIEKKSHELHVLYPPEPLYVHGDPIRLAQVVTNVLNNAAKFTPEKGRIEVTVRAKAGHAIIRVRDNGVGIAPEDIDDIFEMFVQLNPGKGAPAAGLGLGLALARSLISLHGGEITAHSAGPGRGTEFRIRLPLTAAPPATRDATPPVRQDNEPRRVLVVDDNVDAATSLGMLLEYRGHRVQTCFDGSAAFTAAAQAAPDIAFIDLNMPHPDGAELARMIRRQPWGAKVRLVALTGMGQPSDLERTRAAGFNEHLVKPVKPADIFAVLAPVHGDPDHAPITAHSADP